MPSPAIALSYFCPFILTLSSRVSSSGKPSVIRPLCFCCTLGVSGLSLLIYVPLLTPTVLGEHKSLEGRQRPPNHLLLLPSLTGWRLPGRAGLLLRLTLCCFLGAQNTAGHSRVKNTGWQKEGREEQEGKGVREK